MADKKPIKEVRILKVALCSKGNSYYPKMQFPKAWTEKLGVTEEDKEVKVSFDGKKIIIEKV